MDLITRQLLRHSAQVAPCSKSYGASRTYLGASNTSFSEAAVSIGAAAASRVVVVAFGVVDSATFEARPISTVTIGGISATRIVSKTGAGNRSAEMWAAAVPTGITATVAFTFANSVGQYALATWALYGSILTPATTNSGTGTSLAITVPAGGAAFFSQGTPNNPAITGSFTPDVTVSNGNSIGLAGGSATTTTTASLTASTLDNTYPSIAAAFVAAGT